MKNLFFGALALSLFSFTTVDKFESYDYACPDGSTEITWSCIPNKSCVTFNSSWTFGQMIDWVERTDARICDSKPNPTIEPA